MKRIAAISLIGVLIALAACSGGGSKATNTPTPTATASFTRLTSTGHLTIVSPTPNEVIHGSTLHVKVTLAGARIQRLADALPTERTASRWIVSTDPQEHVERIRFYTDLGFTHLVFHAPGPDQRRFLDLYAERILPRLRL